jgi:hypothetical protein
MRVVPLLLALPAAATAAPIPPRASPACAISYDARADLTETIRAERFTFEGYDALCALLDREGMALDIVSSSGVLQERAYGWVSIRLVRTSTRVYGALSRSSTTISREANSPEAQRLTLQSTNSVLHDIARSPNEFVQSVAEEEARLRRALAPTPAK